MKPQKYLVRLLLFVVLNTIQLFGQIQEWITQLPNDNKNIYVVGRGESSYISIGQEKARIDALKQIAQAIGTVIIEIIEKKDTLLVNNIPLYSTYTSVRSKIKENFQGAEQRNISVQIEDGKRVFYVLYSFPKKNIYERLLNELRSDEILYQRLEKTQVIQEIQFLLQQIEEMNSHAADGTKSNKPEWVKRKPIDNDFIYGVSWSDLSNPIQTAAGFASMDMEKGLGVLLSPLIKELGNENKLKDLFFDRLRTSVRSIHPDTSVYKSVEENLDERTYVMLKLSVRDVKRCVRTAIQSEAQLFNALKDSEAYKNFLE
jgi:hypothetical protein